MCRSDDGHTIQRRPQAWAVTGTYRELVRRLPRCSGSRRRRLALVERRGRGMGGLGATREDAAALETVLTEGPRTQGIGGRTSTREVGKAIAEAV